MYVNTDFIIKLSDSGTNSELETNPPPPPNLNDLIYL
jgi:hypothetical protein